MRVLIFTCLLFVTSMVQTENEVAVGDKKLRQKIQVLFPQCLRLSDRQCILDVPPDPRHDISSAIRVKFLRPIKCGAWGVIFECNTDDGTIAFKVVRSVSTQTTWVHHHTGSGSLPTYLTTKETRTMKYLSQMGMTELLLPKLGSMLHSWAVSSIAYQGFGMEYFPHPTILEHINARMQSKIGCGIIFCFRAKWEVKKSLLLSPYFRDMYYYSLDAVMNMWLLGVTHHGLSPDNIYFDPTTRQVKISFFENSVIYRDHNLYLQFMLSVIHDFIEFTMLFVGAVMLPQLFEEGLFEILTYEQTMKIRNLAMELNSDIEAILEFSKLPESPKFQSIWLSYRARNEVVIAEHPLPEEIREHSTFNGIQLSLRGASTSDSGRDSPPPPMIEMEPLMPDGTSNHMEPFDHVLDSSEEVQLSLFQLQKTNIGKALCLLALICSFTIFCWISPSHRDLSQEPLLNEVEEI